MIFRILVFSAVLWGNEAIAQSASSTFVLKTESVFIPASCLDGEVDGKAARFMLLPNPEVCLFQGACFDSDAVSTLLSFRSNCQRNVIRNCLQDDETNACLKALWARLSMEQTDLRKQLIARLDQFDLTTLPKLLQRRLSNRNLWQPDVACYPEKLATKIGANAATLCGTMRASEARLVLERLHYSLDKHGIER